MQLIEVESNPKQQSCKTVCSLQEIYGEKCSEIQGGNQAVMVNLMTIPVNLCSAES